MNFPNFPTLKTKTASRALKRLAIFSIIIFLFFGIAHQTFAADENILETLASVPNLLSGIAETVSGASLKSVALDVAGAVVGFVFYLLGVISGTILTLGGYLMDLGLTLNEKIIASKVVEIGFPITLDIVNLFFILAIIVIAFATILRFERYDIKQLLTKLIVAALLINFSLTLAGLVLDFTGVFSNFFIQGATGGKGTGFSENLVAHLNPQKPLLEGFESEQATKVTAALEFGEGLMNVVVKLFFTVLFTITMAVVILTIAFMIFIRYIALVILIVLMPLAWMLWIIPDTANLSKKWWNEFIKWNFFLPAVTFFLYLSIKVEEALVDPTVNPSTAYTEGQILGTEGLLNFGNMIVSLGLLIAGLMAAQKFGIYGAAAALNYANTVKKGFIGYAGKIGKAAAKGAAAPVTIPAGRAMTNLVNSPSWKGAADTFSKIPGLRGMAKGMYNLTESKKQEIIEGAKAIKGSPDAIMTEAASFTLDPALKAQRAIKLAQEGLLDNFKEKHGEKKWEDLLGAAKSTRTGKEILKHRLDLAEKLGLEEELPKMIGKMAPKDIAKLSPENFASGEVASLLEKRHYSSLLKQGSVKQLKQLAIGLERAAKSAEKEPERYPHLNSLLNDTVLIDPVMQRIIKETDFKEKLGATEEKYESILGLKVSEIEEKEEKKKQEKREEAEETAKLKRQKMELERQKIALGQQEAERRAREESEKGKVKIYGKYTPVPKKPNE